MAPIRWNEVGRIWDEDHGLLDEVQIEQCRRADTAERRATRDPAHRGADAGDPEGREPAAHREVEKRGLHHCARGVELRQGLAGLEGRLKTLSLEFLTRQYDRAIAAPAQS